jgi:hypothetical protein
VWMHAVKYFEFSKLIHNFYRNIGSLCLGSFCIERNEPNINCCFLNENLEQVICTVCNK